MSQKFVTSEAVALGLTQLAARVGQEIVSLRGEIASMPTADQAVQGLAAHLASPTPHAAYDVDMQDLKTLLENGML